MKVVIPTFALAFALFCVACTLAQLDAPCSTSRDCYDMEGNKYLYCNSDNKCAAMTERSFKDLFIGTNTNFCKESFALSQSLGLGCYRIAGSGCTVESFVSCSTGFNANGTCSEPTPSSQTFKREGEKCSSAENERCGSNLLCIREACVKVPKAGERCLRGSCTFGNVCNLGMCVGANSLSGGAACSASQACASGTCSGGTCSFTPRNQACLKDSDCSSGLECNNKQKDASGRGFCFNPTTPAQWSYMACISAKCGSVYFPDDPLKCIEEQCRTEAVALQCSQQCAKRPDNRVAATSPYIYDCAAMTSTKIESPQCSVFEQFKNCEAYQSYRSASSIVSFSGHSLFLMASLVLSIAFFIIA